MKDWQFWMTFGLVLAIYGAEFPHLGIRDLDFNVWFGLGAMFGGLALWLAETINSQDEQ